MYYFNVWVILHYGEGNGNPLQYSCLENPMDGGACKAAVHGIAEGQTRLSDFTFTFHFHALEKEMATHSSVLAWRIPGTGEPGKRRSMGLQSRTRLKWFSRILHCVYVPQLYYQFICWWTSRLCKSKPQWGTISHQSGLRSKSLQAINAGEGVETREPSYTVDGNANYYSHYGEQCGDSLKNWK